MLISNDYPKTVDSGLPKGGTKLPHPDSGLTFELRNRKLVWFVLT